MGGPCFQLITWLNRAHIQTRNHHSRLKNYFLLKMVMWLLGTHFGLGCLFYVFGWHLLRGLAIANLARLVFDEGPPFERVLVVFAAYTFTISWAENSTLKTLTVLFEAARFLTGATFHMVRSRGHALCLLHLGLGTCDSGSLSGPDLGSEGVWCALQCLSYSFLPKHFVL